MKQEKINYFMVGVFVLAGMLALFFMLYKVTGGQSDSDQYYVELKNVTGIKDGIAVTYSGYYIGEVRGVEPVLNNGKIIYRLSVFVKSGWNIPTDSTAKVVMPAIISDKQIEITQGNNQTFLNSGDTINSVESVDIMELVDSIAMQLNQFIPQSTGNVNKLLDKLNVSADKVSLILKDENVEHINNLFVNADVTSKNLAELVNGFSKINNQLDKILNKTDLMLDDNSEDIRYTVIEMKKSIDTVSGRIESIMYNMDATSQNMNEFSRELRNNPGVILGGSAPVDKYSEK